MFCISCPNWNKFSGFSNFTLNIYVCRFYLTVVTVWKVDVFIYDIYRITCHQVHFPELFGIYKLIYI